MKTYISGHQQGPVVSDHHKVSPYRLLASLLQSERNEIAIILTYGIGVGLLSLAVPIGVQTLVNTVTFGSLNQPVVFLVLAVFLGLCMAAVLRTIQVQIIEMFQRRFFSQVALELSYRLPRLSLSGKMVGRFPELVNRFFDVLTVQKSSGSLLLEGFALSLQVVLGLMLLAFYHWFLLGFALVLVASIGIILFTLGRGAIGTAIEESVHKYRVAAWLEDLAARPLLFRAKDARQMALEKADELVSSWLEARSHHFRILLRQVIGSLALQAVASSALLGIGAWLVVNNQLSLGQLVAAEIVVTTALGSLAKFQKHLESYYDLIAALDKLDGLLSLPLERTQGETLPPQTGPAKIELRDITFQYDEHTNLFENLGFLLPAGGRMAILGSNASGKTTLIDLLYGIKPPQKGTLLFDEVDYRDISPEALREQVALVRGLDILFDSVYENVRVGREYVTSERVREVLALVGLLDDTLALKDGIWTKLGPDGSPFSVAQSHALMLARAIAGAPRVLLVDEALDELDEESRTATLEMLLNPTAPWTLLLATHSHSLAERFTNVIDMDSIRQRRTA
jgi:putative ABC transport system ATP-binding protein